MDKIKLKNQLEEIKDSDLVWVISNDDKEIIEINNKPTDCIFYCNCNDKGKCNAKF